MNEPAKGKAWIPVRRSPLAGRNGVEALRGRARLREIPFVTKYVLRADAEAAAAAVKNSTGLALPSEPLTSSASGETALLWMGPDEWLIVLPTDEGEAVAARLAEDLASDHHQLTDVSDYYTVIELSGRRARDMLVKLTTLDVHRRAFGEGQVTGTNFGHAAATLWLFGDGEDGPVFRLFVRWSFADYLWCLLADAGREWGMPEQAPVSGERMVI